MKIRSSRFECSAFKPEHEPKAPGPDVVFLGRSNVGKSSLINRLLGTKGLARTSSQPGRTQSINFYRVNDSWNFIDLPGYGYAKVPEAVRRSWKPMVDGFLTRRRERIALAMLVVDLRHAATSADLAMAGWLEEGELPYVIVATKADKLSANQKTNAERQLKQGFETAGATEVPISLSAQTGLGIRALWKRLDRALSEHVVSHG